MVHHFQQLTFYFPQDKYSFVRIHVLTKQGAATLNQAQAEKLAGENPDAFSRDLYDSIASENFPSWDVYAQIINPADVAAFPVNIYDPTLRWPEDKAPLRRFGKITLNRNPESNFGEVEQVSFNPTAIVPGWDVSADPSKCYSVQLNLRYVANTYNLFLCSSPNSSSCIRLCCSLPPRHQSPPNPLNAPGYSYNPTKRDGIGYVNQLRPPVQPNYIPADGEPTIRTQVYPPQDQDYWSGNVVDFESKLAVSDWDQPRELWNSFKKNNMAKNFISNVALNLSNATKDVRERTYCMQMSLFLILIVQTNSVEGCFGQIDHILEQEIKKKTEEKVPAGEPKEGFPGFDRGGSNRGGVGG